MTSQDLLAKSSQIQQKSNQIQPKSNQIQVKSKSKSNQNQIKIQTKSESNKNPRKSLKSYARNPRSQDFRSSQDSTGGRGHCLPKLGGLRQLTRGQQQPPPRQGGSPPVAPPRGGARNCEGSPRNYQELPRIIKNYQELLGYLPGFYQDLIRILLLFTIILLRILFDLI